MWYEGTILADVIEAVTYLFYELLRLIFSN